MEVDQSCLTRLQAMDPWDQAFKGCLEACLAEAALAELHKLVSSP